MIFHLNTTKSLIESRTVFEYGLYFIFEKKFLEKLMVQTGAKLYAPYLFIKYCKNTKQPWCVIALGGARTSQPTCKFEPFFTKNISYNWANFQEFPGKCSCKKFLNFWLRFSCNTGIIKMSLTLCFETGLYSIQASINDFFLHSPIPLPTKR